MWQIGKDLGLFLLRLTQWWNLLMFYNRRYKLLVVIQVLFNHRPQTTKNNQTFIIKQLVYPVYTATFQADQYRNWPKKLHASAKRFHLKCMGFSKGDPPAQCWWHAFVELCVSSKLAGFTSPALR